MYLVVLVLPVFCPLTSAGVQAHQLKHQATCPPFHSFTLPFSAVQSHLALLAVPCVPWPCSTCFTSYSFPPTYLLLIPTIGQKAQTQH